jgi:threonine synthase
MDILISSNLERLIYRIAGEDSEKTAHLMKELSSQGVYCITEQMKEGLSDFYGNYATEEETAQEIGELYRKSGYVIDTHTAVASKVCRKYREETGDLTPMVIASTASPYKFLRAVVTAIDPEKAVGTDFELIDVLRDLSGVKVPQAIEDIRTAPVLHDCQVDTGDMEKEIARWLGLD